MSLSAILSEACSGNTGRVTDVIIIQIIIKRTGYGLRYRQDGTIENKLQYRQDGTFILRLWDRQDGNIEMKLRCRQDGTLMSWLKYCQEPVF